MIIKIWKIPFFLIQKQMIKKKIKMKMVKNLKKRRKWKIWKKRDLGNERNTGKKFENEKKIFENEKFEKKVEKMLMKIIFHIKKKKMPEILHLKILKF